MMVGDLDRGKGCSVGSGPCEELPLVEHWNGTRWAKQSAPKLPGTELAGVSCPSSKDCTVIATSMFAAQWNGSRWRIHHIPGARGGQNPSLYNVSCASAHDCVAIGAAFYGGAQVPFAVHWNGRRWGLAELAAHPGATSPAVSGVSCEPEGTCLAVGGFLNAAGRQATLIERWHRSRWSVQPSANHIANIDAGLNDVSCPSRTSCTAVGATINTKPILPLAEHWNGSAWEIQRPPSGTTGGSLTGVSCPSPSGCAAVGSYEVNTAPSQALELTSRNGHWSVARVSPPGAIDSLLTAVSCASTTNCIAVGHYQLAENSQSIPFAVLWNGTDWSVRTVPLPAGATSPALERVSCSTNTACIAVGQYTPSSSTQSGVLAEEWNGSGWAIQNALAPPGATFADLAGVSCRPTGVCVAVGGFAVRAASGALAEIWRGTSWSLQTAYSPPGGSYLITDSCPSASACVAVGGKQTAHGTAALVEALKGSTWSTQQTPAPPRRYFDSSLNGVSCVSATTCIGVGTLVSTGPGGSGSSSQPFTERMS